jgi:hypothetical protein
MEVGPHPRRGNGGIVHDEPQRTANGAVMAVRVACATAVIRDDFRSFFARILLLVSATSHHIPSPS